MGPEQASDERMAVETDRWFGSSSLRMMATLVAAVVLVVLTVAFVGFALIAPTTLFGGRLGPFAFFLAVAGGPLIFVFGLFLYTGSHAAIRRSGILSKAYRPTEEGLLVRGLLFTRCIPWSCFESLTRRPDIDCVVIRICLPHGQIEFLWLERSMPGFSRLCEIIERAADLAPRSAELPGGEGGKFRKRNATLRFFARAEEEAGLSGRLDRFGAYGAILLASALLAWSVRSLVAAGWDARIPIWSAPLAALIVGSLSLVMGGLAVRFGRPGRRFLRALPFVVLAIVIWLFVLGGRP